jgi:chromatin assembly factor 1 subunit B
MLASAGDDGNVLLWVPSELQTQPGLGEDRSDDKETWRVKHMCRSSGAEIYDLAWSPDGVFIITGSMDNIARIYNAQTGTLLLSRSPIDKVLRSVADQFLTRSNGASNRGTFALCARSSLGSPQRICGDTVLRPVCSYLQLEDERRPIHPHLSWEILQDGPTRKADFAHQPCTPGSLHPITASDQ